MFNFNISTVVTTELTFEQVLNNLLAGTVLEGIELDNEAQDYFLGRLDAGDSRRFEKSLVKKIGLREEEIYAELDRISAITRPMNRW